MGRNIMKRCATVLAVFGGALLVAGVNQGAHAPPSPAGSPEDANRADLAKMQGDWNAVHMVSEGFTIPDDDAQALFRTVKDRDYTVSRYDRVVGKGTFTIDATKKPKTIDAIPSTGAAKGKPLLGIYEIDDKTFKVCFAVPGKPRPTDFTAGEGSGCTLTIWEHERK
jgi:uncharacterized protein (TIGR03067 family)